MQETVRGNSVPPTLTASLLRHFQVMMGPHGLYQHATKRVPLLREGYCTDDNARAVQTLLRLRRHVIRDDQRIVDELLQHCWRFLQDAEEKPGTYYNFRRATGEWLPQDRSEDMYARLSRAFLVVIAEDPNTARRFQAEEAFARLRPTLESLRAPRAQAEVLLAAATAPASLQQKFSLAPLIEKTARALGQLWSTNASPQWPWFEKNVTYANALFPHAVLVARPHLADPIYQTILHDSTNFLLTTTVVNNTFIPIGSQGWYPQGQEPSRDNQQPIEAGLTTDFLLDYRAAYPDQYNVATLTAPYLWFFGQNTHHIQMADPESGACLDGLFSGGPNPNCGAESMLAYLCAEVRLQEAPPALQQYAYSARQKLLEQS